MRPRKVIVLHCPDEVTASLIRLVLTSRCYDVLTVGEDCLDDIDDAHAYLVYKDEQAAQLILDHGEQQRLVFMRYYDAAYMVERVRLASMRKRGPKKGYIPTNRRSVVTAVAA